ncbi:helix-turn-helix domain-containing protein [Candidatus Woesearchaeota archaeon]|nr:helix-turn-helix domain-containing protein [Candidatus Woesearchaeota archaeon]
MYKFSFKINHKGCAETGLSEKYPRHYITVVDIQSKNPREKQYLYYITGKNGDFDNIVRHLQKSKSYTLTKEVERSKDTLLLIVVLRQKGYIQNIIQKYNGFFIEHHTIYGGHEYWHVGVLDRKAIAPMKEEIQKAGALTVLSIGEVDFAHSLLSKQQKKIFLHAYECGYYELPRRTTIAKLARALKLHSATVGEHLLKAENKIIKSVAKKL